MKLQRKRYNLSYIADLYMNTYIRIDVNVKKLYFLYNRNNGNLNYMNWLKKLVNSFQMHLIVTVIIIIMLCYKYFSLLQSFKIF